MSSRRSNRSGVSGRSSGEGSKGKERRRESDARRPKESSLPNNFGFIWVIDAIEPTLEDEEYKSRYISLGGPELYNEIAHYWFPPLSRKFIRTVQRGQLHRWRMGVSTPVQVSEKRLDHYATASLFFQARQDNFLIVDVDCTTERVGHKDRTEGWRQLTFHHHGLMSEADFAGNAFGLVGSAINSTWMPQILPSVYDAPRRRGISSPTSEGICGKLSLLFGLAAFSTTINDAERIIRESFGFRRWTHHDSDVGIGRYQDRGVVVKIYLDPEADGVTKDHIRKFEQGDYGPIFAYESLSQQEPPSSTYIPTFASPSEYTYTLPSRGTGSLSQTTPRMYDTSLLDPVIAEDEDVEVPEEDLYDAPFDAPMDP